MDPTTRQNCFTLLILINIFQVEAQQDSTDCSVRLVSGTTHLEGRVEILINGEWGTVCDDHWNLLNGHVVCQQLGYTAAVSVTGRSSFGPGHGPIWMDDVICTGTESSIFNCIHPGFGNNNCNHNEDAGVVCISLADNETIRLVDGPTPMEGRVEIFVQGQWGTICDDDWDIKDAQVVCQQLGFGPAFDAPVGSFYGEGTGPIWIDDVQCEGNETVLLQCRSRRIGLHDCAHREDAGVKCFPKADNETIRLMDGPTRMEGRVEIFVQGQWGTICDDYWDIEDAQVVCQQLGFGSAFDAPVGAFYGEGTGPIWLDDVQCEGNETILFHCRSERLGHHNCNHGHDAGVKCLIKGSTAVIEDVRLTGGTSSADGRVEIFIQGEWGTICYKNWDINDAEVVCRQLGFQSAIGATIGDYFGQGSRRIWLDDVQCTGHENTISNCTSRELGTHECHNGIEAGVKCLLKVQIDQIILTRGVDSDEGIVEISIDEVWGTICHDDSWGVANSYVVCRQLGYDSAVTLQKGSYSSQETSRAWDYYFECSGDEKRLDDCVVGKYDKNKCNTNVVYVVCLSHVTGTISDRLEDKSSKGWIAVIIILFLTIAVCTYIGFKIRNRGFFTKYSKDGVGLYEKSTSAPRLPYQNTSFRGDHKYETIDCPSFRAMKTEKPVSTLCEKQPYELMTGYIERASPEDCVKLNYTYHSYARTIINDIYEVTIDNKAQT